MSANPQRSTDDGLIAELAAIIGPGAVRRGAELDERYIRNAWGYGNETAQTPRAIVWPRSTGEVSRVLSYCNAIGQTVVPQGGLSGVVGGACATARDVVVSLERMNGIGEIDDESIIVAVEAGATLQAISERLAERRLVFPVDIGSRATATLGGMIASNAGGLNVVKYGMMRQNVLGLEAVLADGTVVGGLGKVLKDNAGYDLKHIFIGSEGTLGIVTRATVRVFDKPQAISTAFVGVACFAGVARLLRRLRQLPLGTLAAYEVMWSSYGQLIREFCTRARIPFPTDCAFYLLIEAHVECDAIERVLAEALESGEAIDAVVAKSERERAALWLVREGSGEGLRKLGSLVTFDISLPLADMPLFVEQASREVAALFPATRSIALAHGADGNLHLIFATGGGSAEERLAIDHLVYRKVKEIAGSISAEHGIGTSKRPYLGYSRSAAEIELMKRLKSTLDPKGILNPGKVLHDVG
ncbi:MAG: FAD-binding oxidoreductase [Rhodospirillaceae bacterium]|nr:FAD-binding oxidoreductase [Rhodospirillaceae bacterium]